jgi:LmbE family N-acetylglucosaminyl deacetylase
MGQTARKRTLPRKALSQNNAPSCWVSGQPYRAPLLLLLVCRLFLKVVCSLIKSVMNEVDWSGTLQCLPIWQPADQPIVVIAPHPDDETLGVGGFIADQRRRGVEITVIAVTDGENAYAGRTDLAEIRRREQARALERLGLTEDKIIRFGLPDSGLKPHLPELIGRLQDLVSEDTHIMAPWHGDFHPDHEACGAAAEEVASRTGARLTSFFFWTWHLGSPALLSGLPLRSFPLTPDLLAAKAEALSCHHSQLTHPSGEPILPERLLGPARRPFEVYSVQ